jgi:predicted ATP-binding protein involved in virulence
MIVKALEDLFPACQFIATTHSPFVVQAVERQQLQSLGSQPLPYFTDRGIEEIALKVMHIESHEVSYRYLELLDVAKEYYALLEKAKGTASLRQHELKEQLRKLSSRYARNPAFQAYLEMKGQAALGPDGL